MADYDLSRLGAREFQRLVQALARKFLGPELIAFGDGPDGARDLAFQGRVGFPNSLEPWDGYLVVGCKFQQRSSGDPKRDADWVIKQLRSDLAKYGNPDRAIRRPDNYVLATNVSLSAVANSGGRDRVEHALAARAKEIGIRRTACWDANDIRTFVDADADVRMAYAHFITPGDVLSKFAEALRLPTPDFGGVLQGALQKELLADASARLQSAGEDPEFTVSLARVFVDLPIVDSAEEATLRRQSPNASRKLAVAHLMNVGARVLRRRAMASDTQAELTSLFRGQASRVAIVGGPGQGKSTVGQYLCQLYRAALLRDRPCETLEPRVPRIIEELEKQRKQSGGLPAARRYPVRVELRSLSQALLQRPDLSLLEYIRDEINRWSVTKISGEHLQRWLESYPWLLVLDGLDEVPPSSNRADVLRRIDDFWVDVAAIDADLLVVATTRPQTYNNEFARQQFSHIYLAPLSPAEAREYGKRLARARCGDDERRYEELVRSLNAACESAATARLMQSPLQVTIMATLLEETGEPPQQRYRLFAEYYRTIYKRETRRRVLGTVLTERQKDIDVIHEHVGLLLHARGEASSVPDDGKQHTRRHVSELALSDAEFGALVERRFDAIGVPSGKREELLRTISDSSLERLVFLVRPEEGFVRFDIASLKEFMTASALMDGPDITVRERLHAVAAATYWRNVFLFAVGKCFIEKEHMLDAIVNICESLNDECAAAAFFDANWAGRAAQLTMWGSRLALDVLEDGTARQNPGTEHVLVRIALRLTQVSDRRAPARLSAIYHDDLTGVYAQHIDEGLGRELFSERRATWRLVMHLADRGVEWALRLIDARWPSERGDQEDLLLSPADGEHGEWWHRKLSMALPAMDARRCAGTLLRAQRYRGPGGQESGWVTLLTQAVTGAERGDDFPAVWVGTRGGRRAFGIGMFLQSAVSARAWRRLSEFPAEHPSWKTMIASARLRQRPDKRVLAESLEWLAADWVPEPAPWFSEAPWPLAACLLDCDTAEDLRRLAARARAGGFGSGQEWFAAEARWVQHGVTEADILSMGDHRWPFDQDIHVSGFPIGAAVDVHEYVGNEAEEWLDLIDRLSPGRARDWLGSIAFRAVCAWVGAIRGLDPRRVSELCSGRHEHAVRLELLTDAAAESVSEGWIDVLERIGRGVGVPYGMDEMAPAIWDGISRSFERHPEERPGLARLLASFVAQGHRTPVSIGALDQCGRAHAWVAAECAALKLASNRLSDRELECLVDELTLACPETHHLWLLSQVANTRLDPDRAAKFAILLDEHLRARWRGVPLLRDPSGSILVSALTGIPSRLSNPSEWSRLRMPAHD